MGTSAAFITAGTKLSVTASAPATFNAAGYAALTFTEINEITDFGTVGRTYEDITHKPVNNRQTFHFKGGFDDGGLQLQMAHVPDDPGQVLVMAALNSDEDYYFKLEYNDNPDGVTNTIEYFPAKVFSAPKSIGNVSSITSKSVNIMIAGDVIEVAATDV